MKKPARISAPVSFQATHFDPALASDALIIPLTLIVNNCGKFHRNPPNTRVIVVSPFRCLRISR
jgi:hypothetical protein